MRVKVTTHSGDEDIIEVDNYDAQSINDLRNDKDVEGILIGDHSYSRIDLKNIKPLID